MPRSDNWLKRIALGAAGGLAGTFAIQVLLTANQRWLPRALPPMHQEPGAFMVEKGEEMLLDPVR